LYKADEITVSRRTKEALDALHEELGVQTTTDNKEVAEKADVLVLAIKPYQFADVIPEIAPVCKENALVISIAAGQTIANYREVIWKDYENSTHDAEYTGTCVSGSNRDVFSSIGFKRRKRNGNYYI